MEEEDRENFGGSGLAAESSSIPLIQGDPLS
jgi:hypothetical protein